MDSTKQSGLCITLRNVGHTRGDRGCPMVDQSGCGSPLPTFSLLYLLLWSISPLLEDCPNSRRPRRDSQCSFSGHMTEVVGTIKQRPKAWTGVEPSSAWWWWGVPQCNCSMRLRGGQNREGDKTPGLAPTGQDLHDEATVTQPGAGLRQGRARRETAL